MAGKWPTHRGEALFNSTAALSALGMRLARDDGAGAGGASDPTDVIRRAGAALEAARLHGLQRRGDIISSEAWRAAWVATCKGRARTWKNGEGERNQMVERGNVGGDRH